MISLPTSSKDCITYYLQSQRGPKIEPCGTADKYLPRNYISLVWLFPYGLRNRGEWRSGLRR